MSLIELKNYLINRQTATLEEIANFFATDPILVRTMLDIWIHKGKVICYAAPKCNGCNQVCSSNAKIEIFQWQN